MKKILFILASALLLMGCFVSRNSQADNFRELTVGMSKGEVEYWIGPPELYLSVTRTPQGIEEVLQYRNIYNEVFALEFFNDYLISANYIYGGGWYPMYSSVNYYPHPGYPVFPPNYKPNRPSPRPPAGVTPRPPSNSRPPESLRPPSNTRPPSSTRPDTGNSNRPESSLRPGTSTRPGSSGSENSGSVSRPTNTREGSSSRENSNTGVRQGSSTRENSGSSDSSTTREGGSSTSTRSRSK